MPDFMTGSFRQETNRSTGKPQWVMEVANFEGLRTKFVTNHNHPTPTEGEVWIFCPGLVIYEDYQLRIQVADLLKVIHPTRKIILTFSPDKRNEGRWNCLNSGICYVPDRTSVLSPRQSHRKFQGTIRNLVFHDQSKGFSIVTVSLEEEILSKTALRRQKNPAAASKQERLEADRRRQMDEATVRKNTVAEKKKDNGNGDKKGRKVKNPRGR